MTRSMGDLVGKKIGVISIPCILYLFSYIKTSFVRLIDDYISFRWYMG